MAFNLNEIYGQDARMNPALLTERPNQTIRVELRFARTWQEVTRLLPSLKAELKRDNMEVWNLNAMNNAVVVRGTLPEYEYDAQGVLRTVAKYDEGATIISHNIE